MKTYNIPRGTIGFLIIQEDNKNVHKQTWETRKSLSYTSSNIQVDPARIDTFGSAAYEKDSLALQLALDGYYVFSSVENDASSYMLAINRVDVTIS